METQVQDMANQAPEVPSQEAVNPAPEVNNPTEEVKADASYYPYRPPLSLDTITTVTMPVLYPGNNGDAVRYLQQVLISLGYHVVQFNANYDRYTYQGVLEFQRDNYLRADGVVGWHTWRKLGEKIVSRRGRY